MEKQFGKYLLLGRLGGGGMAEVFRARFNGPEGFEKLVALKLILRSYSDEPEFVRMFVQEASLSARLDHANIVRVYEFDQVDDCYYIAMELVDGQDLRKVFLRCRELERKLSVPEVLVIALEICKGLAFAHGELLMDSQEIVHRDISPHNIILSRVGEVKITDFGIAKLTAAVSRTKTGLIKGKVGYMSPEQARGEPVDRRADLFALGCVLWEMLAGKRLFSGVNDQVVLHNLHNMQITPVSYYNSEVGADLDKLLAGLLERDPEKRIDSALEVLTEIDRILQGYPNIQRSTILTQLYSELFSEVSEKPITKVLALQQNVLDEDTAQTIDIATNTKNDFASEPSLTDKPTISSQDTMPQNEEHTDALANRQKTKKATWIGLAALCMILIGFAGYAFWGGFARDYFSAAADTATDPALLPINQAGIQPLEKPPIKPEATTIIPPQPLEPPNFAQQLTPAAKISTTVASHTDPINIRHNSNPEKKPPADSNAAATHPESKPRSIQLANKETASLPPGSGLLQLYSIPPCLVYQGDKLLGETLLEIVLPAGEYTLLLADPKDKLTTRKVKVTVRPQKINTNKFVVK